MPTLEAIIPALLFLGLADSNFASAPAQRTLDHIPRARESLLRIASRVLTKPVHRSEWVANRSAIIVARLRPE